MGKQAGKWVGQWGDRFGRSVGRSIDTASCVKSARGSRGRDYTAPAHIARAWHMEKIIVFGLFHFA